MGSEFQDDELRKWLKARPFAAADPSGAERVLAAASAPEAAPLPTRASFTLWTLAAIAATAMFAVLYLTFRETDTPPGVTPAKHAAADEESVPSIPENVEWLLACSPGQYRRTPYVFISTDAGEHWRSTCFEAAHENWEIIHVFAGIDSKGRLFLVLLESDARDDEDGFAYGRHVHDATREVWVRDGEILRSPVALEFWQDAESLDTLYAFSGVFIAGKYQSPDASPETKFHALSLNAGGVWRLPAEAGASSGTAVMTPEEEERMLHGLYFSGVRGMWHLRSPSEPGVDGIFQPDVISRTGAQRRHQIIAAYDAAEAFSSFDPLDDADSYIAQWIFCDPAGDLHACRLDTRQVPPGMRSVVRWARWNASSRQWTWSAPGWWEEEAGEQLVRDSRRLQLRPLSIGATGVPPRRVLPGKECVFVSATDGSAYERRPVPVDDDMVALFALSLGPRWLVLHR